MKNNDTQLNTRIPLSLRNEIAKTALKKGYSINQECLERLQVKDSFLLEKIQIIESKIDLILDKLDVS